MKINRFVIKNKYYGFEVSAPEKWHFEKNTSYSDDVVGNLLEQCKNGKSKGSAGYEVGDFKLKDSGLPSSAVLEITINCVPGITNEQILSFTSSDYVSFFYNNLQYKMAKYIFIAPADKKNEIQIRAKYAKVFNNIVSSFKYDLDK
ncbi:MAG: hypothetical protein NTV36_03585 [Candidatus Staskawiczbacteria bacterium]|nr:hypothetical protein [Candidatus Staskawiczbacteria bacterium]